MIFSDHEDCQGFICTLFSDEEGHEVNKLSRERFTACLQESKCSWIFDADEIRFKLDSMFMEEDLHEYVMTQCTGVEKMDL